ncbi:MAG: response regulator [Clostridia bacterium]|nr:response regulator [Clostridia bacterium]
MIRVLIAEDEPPIARAVSRMIEELSPSCKVIACASNGQDALEAMGRDPADVVFTDIRMPVMDGLELLQALRKDWPDCLTVILSGHQDFAYLQTALRLGAFDYLPKPISRKKLREVLDRLEDVYAHNLLQEAVGSWRSGGKGPSVGVSFSKDFSCGLILAIAGHWPTVVDDALSPGAVFWQMNDPELLMRDLWGKAQGAITFVGRAAAERVFILEGVSPDQSIGLAKDMFQRLTQISALPKTLCVLPGPLRFDDIASAIRTARKQVYTQIGLCRSALLIHSDIEPERMDMPLSLSTESLTEALYVRNERQISAAVDATVEAAVQGGMTQISFVHFLEAVIHDRRLPFEIRSLKTELGEAMLGAASSVGLKAGLAQLFCQHVLGESKVESKSRVEQIEQYLSTHYAEEISSETLSARFGFVPSYLSKVFRRQTGMSPTEYLAKRRVDKAKELLETNPDLLIRDAAALVGYKDPYYFSKLFKKSTGLWPTQYQEKIVKKSEKLTSE